ncbi:MAG TPA: 3D domain-containing protein [Acidobacteriota bacterium]|jgi:3D (Asp-Asp-Asp) domain-containing protein
MSTNERDHVWIFASALFALFLMVFSGLTIHYTSGQPQLAGLQAKPLEAEEVLISDLPAEIPRPLFDHEFMATAYSDYGITASGVLVSTGIIAADPNVLPMGSIIEIDAGKYSGIYTVMDTGAAVKGEKIDIFIPDYDEALRFGSRKVAVKILRRGWNPKGSFVNAG